MWNSYCTGEASPYDMFAAWARTVPRTLRNPLYEEGERGRFLPSVRNVALENVTMQHAEYALYLRGFANAPIRDVRLTDCDFGDVAKANVAEHVEGCRCATSA